MILLRPTCLVNVTQYRNVVKQSMMLISQEFKATQDILILTNNDISKYF